MGADERRELGRWLAEGLASLLDADARLATLRTGELPAGQVAETRGLLTAALERYESLVTAVLPSIRACRVPISGRTDENGGAVIAIPLGPA